MVGWGFEYFHFHHETKRFTTRFSNAIGKCEFYIILLIKFTTRPRENLVVGVGFGIFWFSPRDHKKILWWGWGLENFHFHHKTTRFTTRFSNAIGKCRFYIILLIKFTTRPKENLLVGVGYWILSFSPRDQEIHHKIFKCYRKMWILYHFINKIHHKTTRKSCGGGGVWNIFIFTTRPRDSPQDFQLLQENVDFISFY